MKDKGNGSSGRTSRDRVAPASEATRDRVAPVSEAAWNRVAHVSEAPREHELQALTGIAATEIAGTARRLHGELGERAAAAGLLDVAYRSLDSPIGPLLLARTNAGLVRVAFENEAQDTVLDELAQRVSPRILNAPARLDGAARELEEYFSGTRHSFETPLDLQLCAGFRRTVLQRLIDVRYGATASYGELARAAGNPRAVRAVGSACATNPLPLVIPCHRVLRSDGSLGGYRGGLEAKRKLLALEGSRSVSFAD